MSLSRNTLEIPSHKMRDCWIVCFVLERWQGIFTLISVPLKWPWLPYHLCCWCSCLSWLFKMSVNFWVWDIVTFIHSVHIFATTLISPQTFQCLWKLPLVWLALWPDHNSRVLSSESQSMWMFKIRNPDSNGAEKMKKE